MKIASWPLGYRISNDDILTNEMIYGDGILAKHDNDMQEHREKYFRRMVAGWYYSGTKT